MFWAKVGRQVSSKTFLYRKKKWMLESLIFIFKFPGRRHLEGNHNTSQLFKMATPGKFENQNERFWKLFISDTNAFPRKIGNKVYRKNFVLWFN